MYIFVFVRKQAGCSIASARGPNGDSANAPGPKGGSYDADLRKASANALGVALSTSTSEITTSEPVMATGMNSSTSSAAHSARKVDAEARPFVRCFCAISTSKNASSMNF